LKLRRSIGFISALIAILLIAACAQPIRPEGQFDQESSFWRGRLSLRIASDQPAPTSFSAPFDLTGNAQTGELIFYTPLGTTAAALSWSPTAAVMASNGEIKHFKSLDDLLKQAIGTELPVAALFAWLAGKPALADGWQVELSGYGNGRIKASRQSPPPVAELSLIIEK
jgi:outer membrane lipoprotein LolB